MKSFEGLPFGAVSTNAPTAPGTWGESKITILEGDKVIGGYVRNYPSFGVETFEPFEMSGSWYALYSRDYTSTRIMRLPSCADLGGEEPASNGFCPVEFWVPRYRDVEMTIISTGELIHFRQFERPAREKESDFDPARTKLKYGPWHFLDMAFVAGCIWGDDSTWKLEVIDLSRADEGIIHRSARFGHVQLGKMPLTEAVRLDSNIPHWDLRATIIRQERRDVRTGALIDPYDE